MAAHCMDIFLGDIDSDQYLQCFLFKPKCNAWVTAMKKMAGSLFHDVKKLSSSILVAFPAIVIEKRMVTIQRIEIVGSMPPLPLEREYCASRWIVTKDEGLMKLSRFFVY